MTVNIYRMGFLGPIWRFILAPSEVAVAIAYHAPWARAELAPARATHMLPAPGCREACPV